MTGKKRKLLPSVFAEPMSHAQLVSLRNAYGTPEALAETMVDSRIVTSYDDALRKARIIFCAPPEPKAPGRLKGKGGETEPAPAPAAVEEPPRADARLFFNRKDVTPQQMTQAILGFVEEMKLGPDKGWQAAKSLVELAVFNKQFGLQAQISLERIANGKDLLAQRTLMALGSYPYSTEVDQMALQTVLAKPKIRTALDKWAATVGHPLRQPATLFLTFMGRKG